MGSPIWPTSPMERYSSSFPMGKSPILNGCNSFGHSYSSSLYSQSFSYILRSQLIINPNVWQAADGKYPYGAMLGNMRFTLENKPENLEAGTLCASQYSFIIWFDETYEGN